MKEQKVKKNMRYSFTPEERLEVGKLLADAQIELCRVGEDKKRVADDFKAKESALDASVKSLSNKMSTGYEFRDIDCTIIYNDPKTGKKSLFRDDTGERIATDPMTAEELQEEIDLENN
jgi:hypothetical protein